MSIRETCPGDLLTSCASILEPAVEQASFQPQEHLQDSSQTPVASLEPPGQYDWVLYHRAYNGDLFKHSKVLVVLAKPISCWTVLIEYTDIESSWSTNMNINFNNIRPVTIHVLG